MLRSSVSEKSKLSIAFSKLYHSSAKKSMRLEKKREKWRFAAGDCGRAGSARRGRLLGRASCNVINLKRLLNGKQNVWKYQNGEEKSDSDGREKDV